MEKIVFKSPFEFEGKSYDGLELNLDKLTGADVMQAEREFAALGNFAGLVDTNKTFQAMLAARSAGVPVEFLQALPAKDFSRITIVVQNFLFN